MSQVSVLSVLARFWASDPVWEDAPWWLKGVQAELLLWAMKGDGTLPASDAEWKKKLRWEDASGQVWEKQVWPALEPHWPLDENHEGRRTSWLVKQLHELQGVLLGSASEHSAAGQTIKAKTKKQPATISFWSTLPEVMMGEMFREHYLTPPQHKAWRTPVPIEWSIAQEWDARWEVTLHEKERQRLWDLGVRCLRKKPGEEESARVFLGGLVKEYGELNVAKALGQLVWKNPIEPKSFLVHLLQQSATVQGQRQAKSTSAHRDIVI